MKISEILLEANSYESIRNKLIDFVVKKMKLTGNIAADAKETGRSTDEFHSDAIHDFIKVLDDPSHIGEVEDELVNAITEISALIASWYGNSMNHAPGFKSQKLKSITFDDLSFKELTSLIKIIDRTAIKRINDAEQKNKNSRAAQKAIEVELAKEALPEVVKVVKKYEEAAWTEYHNFIIKTVKTEDNFISYFGKKVSIKFSDLKTVNKSPKSIKEFWKKEDLEHYLWLLLENIESVKNITKEESDLLIHYYDIVKTPSLKKKLLSELT